MSDWSKVGTKYVNYGYRIRGLVWQEDELWRNRVYIDGDVVDQGEWLDRETAIGNCGGAMSRACRIRRFEKDPPALAEDDEDEDEDDDDDDD